MNRHQRMERKRARRRARVARRSFVKHVVQWAAVQAEGQEKWETFTGLRFPIEMAQRGVPRR